MIFLSDYLPLAHLPNAHGFIFVGLKKDGPEVRCHGEKGADGLHRIADGMYSQLVGWRKP